MPVLSDTTKTVRSCIHSTTFIRDAAVSHSPTETDFVRPLASLRMADVPIVGGKNASLGEMIGELAGAGIQVPGGFATTAQAFREFLDENRLEERIRSELSGLDVEDVGALARCGAIIRGWIEAAPLPVELETAIRDGYEALGAGASVAVRSSATAEDLPEASFAGQQETYLNIRGQSDVVDSVRRVFASLYNDRAIAYRAHQGFEHEEVALSAGIQRMVRSDVGASGVMFTMDTESGFRDVVFITASYGLGECVVQGSVNPDEFYVHKATLAAGKPAILRRTLGSKQIKMVYGTETEPVEIVDVAPDQQSRFSLTGADV
ncbi:MAG: phosphoenolpyruvate synthase, partial [Gammaproteobacteria bacterium]|nr:phosphoenolpyruvate synthase [Gammaproteobacteria bacterium]